MVGAIHFERRRHTRHDLNTYVSVFHAPTGRTFRCQYADLSFGGAMLLTPVSMPVREGHAVRLEPSPNSTPADATIVRVDRTSLLTRGRVAIGIRFDVESGTHG